MVSQSKVVLYLEGLAHLERAVVWVSVLKGWCACRAGPPCWEMVGLRRRGQVGVSLDGLGWIIGKSFE